MALPTSLVARTCVVNVILPRVVATGASSASLPICSAHVTPGGGLSTTTRRVRRAGESIVATPDRGTAVISYSRLTLALSGRPQRSQARGRRKMNSALAARRSAWFRRPLERVVRCHAVLFLGRHTSQK